MLPGPTIRAAACAAGRQDGAVADEIAWYDAHAEALADRCEAAAPERGHGWLQDLLPSASC